MMLPALREETHAHSALTRDFEIAQTVSKALFFNQHSSIPRFQHSIYRACKISPSKHLLDLKRYGLSETSNKMLFITEKKGGVSPRQVKFLSIKAWMINRRC
jgi:hypothetical protein